MEEKFSVTKKKRKSYSSQKHKLKKSNEIKIAFFHHMYCTNRHLYTSIRPKSDKSFVFIVGLSFPGKQF